MVSERTLIAQKVLAATGSTAVRSRGPMPSECAVIQGCSLGQVQPTRSAEDGPGTAKEGGHPYGSEKNKKTKKPHRGFDCTKVCNLLGIGKGWLFTQPKESPPPTPPHLPNQRDWAAMDDSVDSRPNCACTSRFSGSSSR